LKGMTPSKVILLTGFEPFGGRDMNPSVLACRKLEGRAFNGYTAHVGEIRLRYDEKAQDRGTDRGSRTRCGNLDRPAL